MGRRYASSSFGDDRDLADRATGQGSIIAGTLPATLGYSPGGGRLRGLWQRSQVVTEWVRWGPL